MYTISERNQMGAVRSANGQEKNPPVVASTNKPRVRKLRDVAANLTGKNVYWWPPLLICKTPGRPGARAARINVYRGHNQRVLMLVFAERRQSCIWSHGKLGKLRDDICWAVTPSSHSSGLREQLSDSLISHVSLRTESQWRLIRSSQIGHRGTWRKNGGPCVPVTLCPDYEANSKRKPLLW